MLSKGAVAASLLAAVVLFRAWQEHRRPQPPETLVEGLYRVERVVDGATLQLANHATVRLLGIDASATVVRSGSPAPLGSAADAFTRRFVTDAGDQVWLRLDRERLDRQGRFLAYVLAGDRMLNEELLSAGLAQVERECRLSASNKNRFLKLQAQARQAHRGIWSAAPAASDEDPSWRGRSGAGP
jgi:endonuclease YncB( thermonuclease family)